MGGLRQGGHQGNQQLQAVRGEKRKHGGEGPGHQQHFELRSCADVLLRLRGWFVDNKDSWDCRSLYLDRVRSKVGKILQGHG